MSDSQPNRRADKGRADNATLIALTGLLFVAFGLIVLMSAVLPQVSYALLTVLGLFALILFHYVTWGRWLSARLARTADDDPDEDPYSQSFALPDAAAYLDDEELADRDG